MATNNAQPNEAKIRVSQKWLEEFAKKRRTMNNTEAKGAIAITYQYLCKKSLFLSSRAYFSHASRLVSCLESST